MSTFGKIAAEKPTRREKTKRTRALLEKTKPYLSGGTQHAHTHDSLQTANSQNLPCRASLMRALTLSSTHANVFGAVQYLQSKGAGWRFDIQGSDAPAKLFGSWLICYLMHRWG